MSLDDAWFWIALMIFSAGITIVSAHPLWGGILMLGGAVGLAVSLRRYIPAGSSMVYIVVAAMTIAAATSGYDIWLRYQPTESVVPPSGGRPVAPKPFRNYPEDEKKELKEVLFSLSDIMNRQGGAIQSQAEDIRNELFLHGLDPGGAAKAIQKLKHLARLSYEMQNAIYGPSGVLKSYPSFTGELTDVLQGDNKGRSLYSFRYVLGDAVNVLEIVQASRRHPEDKNLKQDSDRIFSTLSDRFSKATRDVGDWFKRSNDSAVKAQKSLGL